MTRIDFYILKHPQSNRSQYCCKLIEKAYKKGCQLYIQLSSADEADFMDNLLWTFRDQSFIPHAQVSSNTDAPVLLGYGEISPLQTDVLINLSDTIPDNYQQFNRVIEITDHTPNITAMVREHYRYYKQHEQDLHSHNIETA